VAKRHEFRPGDWETIATRLDEILSAHTGEDPFEESLKLLVAKLAHEATARPGSRFLLDVDSSQLIGETNRLLGIASDRWRGILEPGSACRLNPAELNRCAEILDSADLRSQELVGLDTVFEFMVNKASKGQKGQYFTPRHVVAEVTRMMGPRPGEQVADPACGSGSFLRHALNVAPACSVFGFDQDYRAVRVARTMIAASGQPVWRVMRVDSLRRPVNGLFAPDDSDTIEGLVRVKEPRFQGFDLIMTNPPFAGDVGPEHGAGYELAIRRKVERDVLFMERCVTLLRPGGRLAIVLPHNKVGGEHWAFARQWLLRHARVTAVIGLGRNTFLPHTSQKACVLMAVRRARPLDRVPGDEEVVFFISERAGKDARGKLLWRSDGSGVVDHDLGEATSSVRQAFLSTATRGT
jgi:type I restriction enzyme M protein